MVDFICRSLRAPTVQELSLILRGMSSPSCESPASIGLLLLDVDGVLTDGTVGLDDSGQEIKFYHARDGLGIRLAQQAGLQVGAISGRGAPSVTLRLQELDIALIIQKSAGKADGLERLCDRAGVAPAHTAFIGDDIVDLPAMQRCGYAIAVADAVDEVRAAADLVTEACGGRGAVRETVEHILKRQNQWETLIARYTR